ncbi:MutS-related protein [Paenibacillus antri]|nr:hypothetical protein [Paenibacillus antri]
MSDGAMSDLGLDMILEEMLRGREGEAELRQWFRCPLPDIDAVRYRSSVMEDIDGRLTLEAAEKFVLRVRRLTECLNFGEACSGSVQSCKWRLDAAVEYCKAVSEMKEAINVAGLRSDGLTRCSEWLSACAMSKPFIRLRDDAFELDRTFCDMKYSLIASDGLFYIYAGSDEADYCAELRRTFDRDGESEGSLQAIVGLRTPGLEEEILRLLRKRHPAAFAALESFCNIHSSFVDPAVLTLASELTFYIACLRYFRAIRKRGLYYCYPAITEKKELRVEAGYDLKVIAATTNLPIGNGIDWHAEAAVVVPAFPERPDSFGRTVGQIIALSALGCPVPARSAVVPHVDRLYTHFPKADRPERNEGKLKEELARLRPIVAEADHGSMVVLNETFSTTSTCDAVAMGRKLLDLLTARGAMCLFVTHLPGFAPEDCDAGRKRVEEEVERYGLTKERLRSRLKERLHG